MKSVEERFWEKVDRRGPDECWEWKAKRSRAGYGMFSIDGSRRNKKEVRAHRMAWELTHKESNCDRSVLQSCRNRICVNPAHLCLGEKNHNRFSGTRKVLACVDKEQSERRLLGILGKIKSMAIQMAPRSGWISADDLIQIGAMTAWSEMSRADADGYLIRSARLAMKSAFRGKDSRMTMLGEDDAYGGSLIDSVEGVIGIPDSDASLSIEWIEKEYTQKPESKKNLSNPELREHIRREMVRAFLQDGAETLEEFLDDVKDCLDDIRRIYARAAA